MASRKPHGAERRQGRTWSFATCTFDENAWALFVDGQRVSLESKPLELLHELLLNAGKVVTKDELLDRIWPDVIVVEASLPTAVRKLRLALGGERGGRAIVETVAGIGYRLAVPVEVERRSPGPSVPVPAAVAGAADRRASTAMASPRTAIGGLGFRRLASIGAGVAVLAVALAVGLGQSRDVAASPQPVRFDQRMAANALRRLDIDRIEEMIAAGWDPNTPFDSEGNTAINYVLNMCEWDRGHDRRRLLLMVRTLHDAGNHIDRPNIWGDTAYSIAKAPRYCGPDHPVTVMLRDLCYGGGAPLAIGDRCLATYELARRRVAPAGQGAGNP
jgi:DNA-binding winged helix-turn-helix (wHTH) protein